METVVITGANRGIGLGLVNRFAGAGARVYAGCRNPDEANELSRIAANTDIIVKQLDVSNAEHIEHLRSDLAGLPVDILINNAGIIGGDRQSISDMDYEAWRRAFEVNTIAPFRLTMALRSNLTRGSTPRVATISSQMGALSRRSAGSFAYRSSKAAVNKVMQVMAIELESDGIIVCPIHPGWVRTDMGGPHADISVDESADGLFDLINNFKPGQSGRFWKWNGEEHDW